MILPREDSESNLSHCRRVHHKRRGANPYLRSGMPSTSCLSHGTAAQIQDFEPRSAECERLTRRGCIRHGYVSENSTI